MHIEPKIILESEGQSLLGGRQTIKLFAEDTNGSLSFMFSEVPAGTGVPIHTHQNEDEIFQIVDGLLEVTIDGKVHSLNRGDMVFLPRNIPHGLKAIKDTKMWVSFTPAGAERMFTELAALPPGPPNPQDLANICGRYAITFG